MPASLFTPDVIYYLLKILIFLCVTYFLGFLYLRIYTRIGFATKFPAACPHDNNKMPQEVLFHHTQQYLHFMSLTLYFITVAAGNDKDGIKL